MKDKPSSTAFSLPVLLSFNELAWIALFAMGLVCAGLLSAVSNGDGEGKENDLQRQVRVLFRERDEATKELARLRTQLEQVARERENATKKLEALEKANREAARLVAELETAHDTINRLNGHVAQLRRELDEVQSRLRTLTARLESLEAELRRAQGALEEKDRQIAEAKDKLSSKEAELDRLAKTNQDLTDELNRWPREGVVRQALVGLRGRMTNVVILLDRSESMGYASGRSRSGGARPVPSVSRWDEALATIEAWLRHLPVEKCVLITFNNDRPQRHPRQGMMVVGGPSINFRQAETNREELITELKGLKPSGATDTYSALEVAYSYTEADTIILFTDGNPTVGPVLTGRGSNVRPKPGDTKSGDSKELQRDILRLADRHHDKPINTVAVGKYYDDPDFAEFLIELSGLTGGVFLGR